MRFTSYAWNSPAVFQSADPDNFETLTFWDGTPINYFELDHLILKHRVRLFGSGTNHPTYHHNKFVCPGDGEDESNVGHIFGCTTTPDTCRNIHIYENLFLADDTCSYDGFSARPNWMHLYGWSDSVIENNDFRSTGVTINNGVGPKMANQNLEIRYNYIQGNVEEPLWFNGCPDNRSTCGNRAYQNVIDGGASHSVLTGLTWWSSTNQANKYFYNSTVYNASRCLYAAADRGLSGNHFFNNICVGIEQEGQRWEQHAASAALIVSDYNLYSPDPTFRDCWYGGVGCTGQQYGSVAAWAGGTSLDTHSLTTNPLLGDPGSGDFRPCIDVGVPHPLCTGPSPAIRHCEGGPNHGTGCSSNGDCGGANCVASGRGGPWPSVMGAYITGQEQIGCSFDPACFSSNADRSDDSENPTECTSDAACDDGDICNGEERCIDYACEPGLALSCSPPTDCALTLCDPEAGCQVEPVADGTSCNDGDPNTLADQCDAGNCVGVAPVCGSGAECDDGNACTADHCDPLAGCLSEPVTNGMPCEDGLSCTTGESCQNGSCSSGLPVSCNDQSVCTTDGCDEELGCVHGATADGTPCDDDDERTGSDHCDAGQCVGIVPECTTHGDCDDGDVCNGSERCTGNACIAGSPLDCPPPTQCTGSLCDPERGCLTVAVSNGTSCDDGEPSTIDDACASGVCVGAAVSVTLTSLTANLPAPQPVGTSITFTAVASGHGQPLEYRWWIQERGMWMLQQEWSPSSTFVWTPSRAGRNARVGVWVRAVGERRYVKATLPFPIEQRVAEALPTVSLSSDLPAPQPVGTPITFTAEAAGDGATLEYRWWVRERAGWRMARDWSPSATFGWTPTRADRSTRVGVWVRAVGETQYVRAALPFPINEASVGPPRAMRLSSDLSAPQTVGTSITFTADAGGEGESLEFRWWVRQAGRWVMVQDWSPASTFVWTPDVPDPKAKVGIWVRETGQSEYDIRTIRFPIRAR